MSEDTWIEDAYALSVGMGIGCALTQQSEILCWALEAPSAIFAVNPEIGTPSRLACGRTDCCASDDAGRVACWIGPEPQQPTFGPAPALAFDLGQPVLELAAGDYTSCALLADQSVQCWSWNRNLEPEYTLRTVSEPDALDLRDIDVDLFVVCGLLADGDVVCGDAEGNWNGVLGGEFSQMDIGAGALCAVTGGSIVCGED